jgi:hypothetical protein
MLLEWCEGAAKDSQSFNSEMLQETVRSLADAEPAIYNRIDPLEEVSSTYGVCIFANENTRN